MPRKSKTPKLTADQIAQLLTPIPARIHCQITWVPADQEMPDDETEVLFATADHVWLGYHADGIWWANTTEPDEIRQAVTHWAHIQHPKDIPAVVPL